MIPPKAILFISDLHLGPQHPELQDLFIAFLKGPAQGAQQLYILGDLFDLWIGEDIQTEHQHEVAALLANLATQGTQLFFMDGNRDFLITQRYLDTAHCQKIPDPSIIQLHGTKTLLTHGDNLCTQDIGYQRYRRVAQHPIMRFIVRHLPNFIRQKLAFKLRARSKVHQSHLAPEILDVTPEAVVQMMQQYDVQQMIHGHVHRPKIHVEQLGAKTGQRFVLGDWHHTASILLCTQEGITLATFSPSEGVKMIEGALAT